MLLLYKTLSLILRYRALGVIKKQKQKTSNQTKKFVGVSPMEYFALFRRQLASTLHFSVTLVARGFHLFKMIVHPNFK